MKSCGSGVGSSHSELDFSKESGVSEPSCSFWVSHLAELGAGVRSLGELEDFVSALLPA